MLQDVAEMAPEKPVFHTWRADKRRRFSKLAQDCLQALLRRVGNMDELPDADLFDIEDAALAQARARLMVEKEARGLANAGDVATAMHIARRATKVVDRIARRMEAKRKGRRR